MRATTVPVPQVKEERVAVPSELLKHLCEGVAPSSAATYGELEDVAVRLWICVQDANAAFDRIGALK